MTFHLAIARSGKKLTYAGAGEREARALSLTVEAEDLDFGILLELMCDGPRVASTRGLEAFKQRRLLKT